MTYKEIRQDLIDQIHTLINQSETYDILEPYINSFCITYADFETSYQKETINSINYYDYRIRKACELINDLADDFDITTKAYKAGDTTTTTVDTETNKESTTTNNTVNTTDTSNTINNTTENINNDKQFTYPDGTMSTSDKAYIAGEQDGTSNATSETVDTSTINGTNNTDVNSEGKDTTKGTTTIKVDRYNQHYYDTQLGYFKKVYKIFELALLSLQVVTIW